MGFRLGLKYNCCSKKMHSECMTNDGLLYYNLHVYTWLADDIEIHAGPGWQGDLSNQYSSPCEL